MLFLFSKNEKQFLAIWAIFQYHKENKSRKEQLIWHLPTLKDDMQVLE